MARGYAKSEEYFDKMGNREIGVLPTQTDFGSGFEAKKVSKSKRERREKGVIDIESTVGRLKDMFTNSAYRSDKYVI